MTTVDARALRRLLCGDDLDLVVLNAGVLGAIKDLADTSLQELREVMDIDVWANKQLIDLLLARDEGRIMTPDAAAAMILDQVAALRERQSGSFVDIRTL